MVDWIIIFLFFRFRPLSGKSLASLPPPPPDPHPEYKMVCFLIFNVTFFFCFVLLVPVQELRQALRSGCVRKARAEMVSFVALVSLCLFLVLL
jgi:hypothetical protein